MLRHRSLWLLAVIAVLQPSVAAADIERINVPFNDPEADNLSLGPPAISDDGGCVAFASLAGNLVPNDTNNLYDVFVYDRSNDTLYCASRGLGGAPGDNNSGLRTNPLRADVAISPDGRWVAFSSIATNLEGTGVDAKRLDVSS